MNELYRYREPLLSILASFLAEQRRIPDLNPWRSELIDRLEPLATSGKLLRGCLVCFTHDAFGGQSATALDVGAVLELIHTALLIHDDIMDQDDMRRGRPTLHRQYEALSIDKSKRFGESMALCVADAAIFMTFELMGRIDLPGLQKNQLLQLFGKTLFTVCGGQMLDVEQGSTTKQVSKQTIDTVMQQKTAAYSISLPLAAGALLAEQSPTIITSLTKLGNYIGTIFQIRDDELGIFGDMKVTGKPVGSDIREGKKTLLYYYMLKLCPTEERPRLKHLFGDQSITSRDIDYLRQALQRYGVLGALDQEVAKMSDSALKIINQLPLGKADKATLQQFVTFCSQRNS